MEPDDTVTDTVPWRALLEEAARTLGAGGIERPHQEARRIVEEATGRDGAELIAHLDDPATVGGVAALDRMVERRLTGEPLQYVLGRWGFRRLDLMVDRRALIPRPETEGLVDHVLAELDRLGPDAVVVDLGTGTGAIGLAVAQERPRTAVHLTDVDGDTLDVARANLAGIGVAGATVLVHHGDWFAALPADLAGRVGIVASNPPYVAADDPLPAEVVDWEPGGALVSGPAGTEAIAAIVAAAPGWLVADGAVVIEIGETQGDEVIALARAAGFVEADVHDDLAGRPRVLVARSPQPQPQLQPPPQP